MLLFLGPGRLIPFMSIVFAGTVSLVVVRQGELLNGVAVTDEDGKVRGQSKVAAQHGISQCAIARVLWNIPVLIFPPVMMARMSQTPWMRANPRARVPLLAAVSTVCVGLGVYPAQAIFPQQASASPSALEPQFHGIRRDNGEPVRTLWYNKGL